MKCPLRTFLRTKVPPNSSVLSVSVDVTDKFQQYSWYYVHYRVFIGRKAVCQKKKRPRGRFLQTNDGQISSWMSDNTFFLKKTQFHDLYCRFGYPLLFCHVSKTFYKSMIRNCGHIPGLFYSRLNDKTIQNMKFYKKYVRFQRDLL